MDEREFDDLYGTAARRLVAVTFAACGNLQEAQDCVQEAFVRAWSRRAELDGARVDLLRALRTLPPRTRVTVALHYLADLPVEAIAEQTGTPVNTVKSHLARGRAALRAVLDDTPQEADRA